MTDRRRHRSFMLDDIDPITFDIEYRDKNGEKEIDTFEAHGELPYATVKETVLLLSPSVEGKANYDEVIVALDRFYSACVAEKDKQRFIDFVSSGKVPLRTMVLLAYWLIEELSSGFPTSPSSPSPTGPTEGGTGSTDEPSETD